LSFRYSVAVRSLRLAPPSAVSVREPQDCGDVRPFDLREGLRLTGDEGFSHGEPHLLRQVIDVDYPEVVFKASRFESQGGSDGRLAGSLTIKGVTRDVVLTVERHGQAKDPWGNERAAFSAKTAIERKDFGLTWNQVLEAGGVMVGERVDIEIDIQAVRQAAATKVA
jgi:YceI-like domain